MHIISQDTASSPLLPDYLHHSISSINPSVSSANSDSEEPEISLITEISDYFAAVDNLVDFTRARVAHRQFHDLWGFSEFRTFALKHKVTYNSTLLTLQIRRTSNGLHNAAWHFLSTATDAMVDEGFLPLKDLEWKSRRGHHKSTLGLIAQAENHQYDFFDQKTTWRESKRTPDWSLFRVGTDPSVDKPLAVMEIGVSQPLRKSKCPNPKKESLQDRAEAWLLASNGVTKVVILVDLSKATDERVPVAGEIDQEEEVEDELLSVENQGLRVTVQVWRLMSGLPGLVENHRFVLHRDSEQLEDDEFTENITILRSDLYDDVTELEKFVIPLNWLRVRIIDLWGSHVERPRSPIGQ